jgi:hypothetical protein
MRDDLDDDAYFDLLRSVENEITRLIEDYIPFNGHEYEDRSEMDYILFAFSNRLNTFNSSNEADKWNIICRKSRELQISWEDLASNARSDLLSLFSVTPFNNQEASFKTTSHYEMAQFLNFGGDILTEVEKEGRQLLNAGTSAGRRNIRAIAVVDPCRV